LTDQLLGYSTMARYVSASDPTCAGAKDAAGCDQAFHVDSLFARCLCDREFCIALVHKFVARATELSGALVGDLESQRSAELAAHAHALAGLAANASAESLRFWASALERAARSSSMQQAAPLVRRVGAEVERCISGVPAVLHQLDRQS
jgi:HPt (histidine-containing phosphotransfer) domain-containing protein